MAQANARVAILTAGACVAALGSAATAYAQGGGGAAYPQPPALRSAGCVAGASLSCARSSTLLRGAAVKLRGSRLDQVVRVVFEGGRGRADDASSTPTAASTSVVEAVVPSEARSGRLLVIDELGRRSSALRVRVKGAPSLDIAPATKFFFDGRRRPSFSFNAGDPGPVEVEVVRQSDATVVATLSVDANAGENTVSWNGAVGRRAAAPGSYEFRVANASMAASARGAASSFNLYDHVFPIRGRHDLGPTRTNRFGGGRGHQGIDMFARCGTPLAAARGGRVQYAGYHARAGNYMIIDGRGTSTDYVYMHMNAPPLVRTGQRVFTGQKIGEVGDSGNASGCHLHFETWGAPGWYEGGKPFDPRPSLTAWDSYS